MSNGHSELCAVCSTLNLTFRYPPTEIPYEEWLAGWEKQRPRYDWRRQDRSWEARWKRLEKRTKARTNAKLRRLLDGRRCSDSDSEDETDYSMSTWSEDVDEDDVSDVEDGGSVVSDEDDNDDIYDSNDGGEVDEVDKEEGMNGEDHAEEMVDGLDSDSYSDSDLDSQRATEIEVSGSGSRSNDDDKDSDKVEDEEQTEFQKKLRAEMDERGRQRFRRVLEYLGMDPSQYREERRPNSKYARPYVLKCKRTEGAESEYE